MERLTAVLAGSTAAVLVQPLIAFCWLYLPRGEQEGPLAMFFIVAFYIMLVAAPFVLFLGIPSALLLSRWKRLRWWPLALIGVAPAAIAFGIVLLTGDNPSFPRDFDIPLLFTLHGFIGASVFYAGWSWIDPPPRLSFSR